MRHLSSLALLFSACNGDVAVTKVAVDRDNDGYDVEADCDDARNDVNPTAPEACDGLDNDCDGVVDDYPTDGTTSYADADGDGAGDPDSAAVSCETEDGRVADGSDCDDADDRAYPDAVEVCDGVDNDCDSLADEGDAADVSTWYRDADGDGWGDVEQPTTACDAPAGYVATSTDCDDADAAIHPDAAEEDCTDPTDYNCDGTVAWADWDGDGWAACEDCDDADAGRNPALAEVCDEADVDEDCDGQADDADASATNLSTWYGDSDGDGYGDPASAVDRCDAPSGYGTDATDCDDGASGVNPGASEVCDAADTDEDCDGLVDDADDSVTGTTPYYADDDSDGHGSTTTTVSVCEAPTGWLTTSTDCDDADLAINPDATDRCMDTVDQDCDGVTSCSFTIDDASRELIGVNPGDYAGYGLSWAGDTNADGFDDLLVGAAHADGNGSDSGAAYLVTGGVTGDLDLASASAVLTGERLGDYLGYTVGYAGDVDRDGFDDVLVNAHGNNDGGTDAGKVYLLHGPVTTMDLGSADTVFIGENANDRAGCEVVGGGDADGDGYDDLLIGAYGRSSVAGAAYLLTSYSGSTVDLSSATAIRTGESADDYAGWFVDFAGDIDADGYDDMLVSAQGALSGAGATYVLLGPQTGTASLSTADARLTGWGGMGAHVRGAGDVDADGYDDFLIGSSGSIAWLVYGPLPASGSITSAAGATITTSSAGNEGTATDGGGDVDVDGHTDVLVGNPYASANTGAVYLYFGPLAGSYGASDADVTFTSTSSGDYFSTHVRFVGDHDGDGRDDFAVAAWGEADGGTLAGAVWVYLTSDL